MEFEIVTFETVKRTYRVEADSEQEAYAMGSDEWEVMDEKGYGEEIDHFAEV